MFVGIGTTWIKAVINNNDRNSEYTKGTKTGKTNRVYYLK